MRHGLLTKYDPKPGVSISTLAWEYPSGFDVVEHAHHSDQLVYATRGVMEVRCGQSLWLIPPQFAIWIPARKMHSIRMPGAVSMRTLYLRRGLVSRLPEECVVLIVSPLLRELVVEAVRVGRLRAKNPLHAALRDLIVSHVETASPLSTALTLPEESRALSVARSAITGMSESPPLKSLCAAAGIGVRTLERIFARETGVSFQTWKRQARILKAIELLVAGTPVKEVAYAAGFRQPSAFIEAFRRTLGATPAVWASAHRGTYNRE